MRERLNLTELDKNSMSQMENLPELTKIKSYKEQDLAGIASKFARVRRKNAFKLGSKYRKKTPCVIDRSQLIGFF